MSPVFDTTYILDEERRDAQELTGQMACARRRSEGLEAFNGFMVILALFAVGMMIAGAFGR